MLRTAFFLILSFISASLFAQSTTELEGRLRKAKDKNERMSLLYNLAKKYYQGNSSSKAADYAYQASEIAIQIGDKRTEADALSLSADALYKLRRMRDADARYQQAWQSARNYGYADIAAHATERLMEINQSSNPSDAVKWGREAIRNLKGSGSGGSPLEGQLRAAEADNRKLREQLAQITGQTQLLETTYKQTEAALKETQEKTQEEILKRESELSVITQQKEIQDSVIRNNRRDLEFLSKAQLADSVIKSQQASLLQSQKREIAEEKLARQISESLRNMLAVVAIFVLVIAALFYLRYRAKKRTANQLSLQNRIIEEEKSRSDNLLLNILPPAIAQELKTRNKVAAQKYDQATVLFLDFKGFTQISEKLSPENLVEELDYCFSSFDNIIEKFRIEKIKTIGDAYLCASGLSDLNASPSDMIKAALEMQDFLLHHKAERMGLGLPYFEARIGIHTGPVVAGVVGAKKFAYDIWGDTVNIAARFQEECEIGRVNVSEDTHQLAKYEFEWLHRGKIAAKNKGMLDMYYVLGIKGW